MTLVLLLLHASAPISAAPATIIAARLRRPRGVRHMTASRNESGNAVEQKGQAVSSVATWRLQAGQGAKQLMTRPRRYVLVGEGGAFAALSSGGACSLAAGAGAPYSATTLSLALPSLMLVSAPASGGGKAP